VENKLNKLKSDKSAGPDGMHPRVLKECSIIKTSVCTLQTVTTARQNTSLLERSTRVTHFQERFQVYSSKLQTSEPYISNMQTPRVARQRQINDAYDRQ